MKLRNLILNLKIRQKIFYPAFLISIFLIVLFSSTFLYVIHVVFEKEARNNLMTLASTMGMLLSIHSRNEDSLGEFTQERQRALLVSLLEPAKMKKEFIYLALFDRHGKLIERYSAENRPTNKIEEENRSRVDRIRRQRVTFAEKDNNQMVFVTPIYLSGIFEAILIGSVSTTDLDNKLNLVIIITLSVSAIILLFSAILLRRLANSISSPVSILRDAADDLRERRFDTGFEKLERRRWGKDELGFLKESFRYMGENLKAVLERLEDKIALVNADLKAAHEELQKSHDILQTKQKLMERELAFAREIQEKLLPPLPKLANIELGAKMHAAASVGGDFYSIKMDREKNFTVIIGDVSGHGVPSALIMVLMREAFLRYSASGILPQQVLGYMNKVARADFSPEMFTTAFIARFEPAHRKLIYANAGHNLPVLVKATAAHDLDTSGFALGISEDGNYGQSEISIDSGDILFLYTDGLAELRHRRDGHFLGTDKIKNYLLANYRRPVRELVAGIEQIMRDHGDEPPYDDDATYFIMKFL